MFSCKFCKISKNTFSYRTPPVAPYDFTQSWKYNIKLHEPNKRKMENGYENPMIFCVSFFIFCLEPTVREQLDEDDFRHCYGIFFRKYRSETTWSSHVQSSFATITRHFDNDIWNNTLQLKILLTWITIWTNWVNIFSKYLSFLGKYLETIIDDGAWTYTIYTIIPAYSLKNIAPRYFTYCCMLLILSNKPGL